MATEDTIPGWADGFPIYGPRRMWVRYERGVLCGDISMGKSYIFANLSALYAWEEDPRPEAYNYFPPYPLEERFNSLDALYNYGEC
jgi:hypothetical protein